MIIWLASYPKSGNTWVRLFLNSLFKSKDSKVDINNIRIRQFPLRYDFDDLKINVDNIQEFISNCILCQDKINLDNSIKFFKTHNALWKSGDYSFTNLENTHGVIHIVRDPRNIITSVKNHFFKDTYEDAFKFMINEKQSLGSRFGKEITDLPTVVSSWSNHYNSWKKIKKNYLLIKYENLLSDTKNEFIKIINYLKKNLELNFDEKNVDNIITNCSFENLQQQESKKGFSEASKDQDGKTMKFFYLGPKNNWKEMVNPKMINKIEATFQSEMKTLGYL